nr:gamma-glutamylcyclotransferase [Advenella mandrilli]
MKTPLPTALHKAIEHIQKFRLWTDEERELSMLETLAEHPSPEEIWVFGYGSLIWRPEFHFQEDRLATLQGYHRSLCLWSSVNRGTPEQPGLVFGLDSGGTCQGKVFKLHDNNIHEQFRLLWKREMPSGAYIPKWIKCETMMGPITALAFVMDINSHAYIQGLTRDETLDIVLNACGTCGPCPEYVLETASALAQASINDENLFELADLIKQRIAKP